MPHTSFPTPAPVSPSTTRRSQCGAASAAIHAPAPASAPHALGSAARAPDQKALALRPSLILSASFPHLPFPADHAPPAPTPSPPAAPLPAPLLPPPQTHSAIPHAVPIFHPDSASAQPHSVLLAGKVPPGGCKRWSPGRVPES